MLFCEPVAVVRNRRRNATRNPTSCIASSILSLYILFLRFKTDFICGFICTNLRRRNIYSLLILKKNIWNSPTSTFLFQLYNKIVGVIQLIPEETVYAVIVPFIGYHYLFIDDKPSSASPIEVASEISLLKERLTTRAEKVHVLGLPPRQQ